MKPDLKRSLLALNQETLAEMSDSADNRKSIPVSSHSILKNLQLDIKADDQTKKTKNRKRMTNINTARYAKALFILDKFAKNATKSIPHEHDEQDRVKHQTTVAECQRQLHSLPSNLKDAEKGQTKSLSPRGW